MNSVIRHVYLYHLFLKNPYVSSTLYPIGRTLFKLLKMFEEKEDRNEEDELNIKIIKGIINNNPHLPIK